MNTLMAAPALFTLEREGFTEQVISGYFKFVAHEHEHTNLPSPTDLRLPSRSLLKPWQFLALKSELTQPEHLLGIASHSGQQVHLDALRSMIAREDEDFAQHLVCPACSPYDMSSENRANLIPTDKKRLHHFCSGKHLNMLKVSRQNGWPLESYHELAHPAQLKIRAYLREHLNEDSIFVTDSCGLPNAVLTLDQILVLYRDLVQSKAQNKRVLVDTWRRAPVWTGGFGRLDTELMECSEGRMIAKEGADGLIVLQGCGDPAHEKVSLIVKSGHGLNSQHLAPIIYSVLMANHKCLPSGFKRALAYLDKNLSSYCSAGHNYRFKI